MTCANYEKLRAALIGLIGTDDRDELMTMEKIIQAANVPALNKTVTIDAIHTILETMPEEHKPS